MEFNSYQMVATNTASLNTASYLNRTEYSMFVNGFTTDLWYGFSANDVVELGVWDRDNNFVGWNVLNASKSFDKITLSYYNTLNFPVTYSYTELRSDFILYKNSKILVNPCEQLSSSFGILDGSYFLTYNFTREMAGTDANPLVIKDISPSRRELKLIPIGKADASYNAFCKKQVLLRDVSPLYLESLKNCPYGQIYSKVSPLYQKEINTIKSVFFLNTDGAMVSFLRNLYEDIVIYSTTPRVTDIGVESSNGQIIQIQGIQTYFNNYLLSNSDNIVDFSDLDKNYSVFVTSSIERKFAPIGAHPPEEYVKAKAFVYDFFTKYFYTPIADLLSSTYKEKYFTNFRNALNFGNNRLLPILEHGVMDEKVSVDDPLTLLVKLESELPMDISIQESCWVSNIAFSPYVVNAIVKNPSGNIVHKIGAPNFSIPIPNVSLTNTNVAYTSTDLEESNANDRELTVSRNLTELSVDYTDFQNFVVFSSAELRLRIFQNKVINLSTLSASAQALTDKNNAFISASGSIYPYYVQEYDSVQSQMTDIVNSFDGYESYLYRSGIYTYVEGTFISSSYITELNSSASAYDKNNRDSLINNCPKHISENSDSDDYIIFLSMIGHFFDGIYSYISNIPSERRLGHTATEEFTRRVVDYMLETFGWKMDDSLEYATLLNNYLTAEQQEGLNLMSAEERLKAVRNRILINLPGIYKTKGTEESVRLILACYGVPSALLSIREYGGVNYTDDSAAYTTYERSFMYQWDTSSVHDYFRSNLVPNCKTYLLKFSVDDSSIYPYDKDQIMLGIVSSSVSSQSAAGSGEWALGFTRVPGKNLGKIFFRVGHNDDVAFRLTSSAFPLFDGSIYSVMLRRNLSPEGFQHNPNTDAVPSIFDLYVQKNEFGNQILKLSSSYVSYDYGVNNRFSTCASGSYLMLGGWFADHNGQGFVGTMDKLQVWYDSITDGNFEDYVNSINAYSFSGSRPAHQSLVLRMHTDYPFDVREAGTWRNANPFYAVSSSVKIESYLGEAITADMDMITSVNAWSGSQVLVETTCSNYSQSVYPFQFKVVDYPSTWGISKYGPNKFRNEKIRHISQSVEARFDDKARSTYVPGSNTAPDSNQIGFFVDPQDFRNKDIVRYFGNYDFMDAIGDPTNRYSSSYQTLNLFRKEYSRAQTEYSGSKTLFNELITLHKLYFNRTIFEAIKNVVPARCNTLTGIVIEPTILERPKYPIKSVFSEMNTGLAFYYDTTAAHYFRDPNTKLCRLTESLIWTDFNIESGSLTGFDYTTLPDNKTMDLNVSYLNLPTRVYPSNYLPLGHYCPDISDPYQLGHFGSGVELDPLIILPYERPLPPTASFIGTPTIGKKPLTVQFTNLSSNAVGYSWTFGDGGTSFQEHPSYTYVNTGTYTVSLTVIGHVDLGGMYDTKTSSSMIVVTDYDVPPVVEPTVCTTGYYNGSVAWNGPRTPFKYTINVGDAIGSASIVCNTFNNVPCRFVVYFDNVKVKDSGWRAGDAVAYSYPLAAYHAASAVNPPYVDQGVTFNAFGFGVITTPGKNITLNYAKNSPTTTAEVWVYAEHGDFVNLITGLPNYKNGAKWNFTSSCAYTV